MNAPRCYVISTLHTLLNNYTEYPAVSKNILKQGEEDFFLKCPGWLRGTPNIPFNKHLQVHSQGEKWLECEDDLLPPWHAQGLYLSPLPCIFHQCILSLCTVQLLVCLQLTFNFLLNHWVQINVPVYTLFNKNQAAWNFVRPYLEVTWRTVAIIIWVILLSPYLCIRGVSLSSIHYNQSCRIFINQRHEHVCFIWS